MVNRNTSYRVAAPEIYYISTTLEVWRRPDMPGSLFRGSLQLSDFMIFILFEGWLRGGDLNPGPLGYEPNELSDCSTPRHCGNVRHARWECQAIVQHVSASNRKDLVISENLEGPFSGLLSLSESLYDNATLLSDSRKRL